MTVTPGAAGRQSARPAETRAGNPGGYIPSAVLDVELSDAVPAIPATGPDGIRRDRAWLLVRVYDEPVGTVTVPVGRDGCPAESVAAAIDTELGAVVRERAAAGGVRLTGRLPTTGFLPTSLPPHRRERLAALRAAPPISVVISTRDRPETLARCVTAVLAQRYPRVQVIIVDNAPSNDRTRQWAQQVNDRSVDYVVQPRPGLSWARNAGITQARGEIVAFIDDDEVPDPHWLAEIARAFTTHPEADAVSGVIVPAELETPAQDLFEQYGGHSKGRGFTAAVFSPATAREQHPMYPLPPFGAGGNMAFRRTVFTRDGSFDVALGAGTDAQGAEDTEMLTRLLLRGGTVVYQPSALVWHYHRATWQGLVDAMRGYGIGLTAYYTSLVLRDPRRLVPLARLAPAAVRDMFTTGGQGAGHAGQGFPPSLLAAKRRGMLAGPYRYVRARARARRLARLI
ncbi:glycosyltransferase [Actinoplanes sp. TBRC 11911]|uniref:glycosyltransferase family 2 protein n=1 Tax=Actinoplanes sp. TBRC 11911 TaxID=2729386 RepID=UPI00145D6494|nr:glycosyltransferase family 2 protein [Actinoplanes sp. TBRC 11911]NMO52872.1 glycosyltransferase [Actinoplanes sp. TBRC 11911]